MPPVLASNTQPRVLCVCREKCSKKTYENEDGEIVPGQMIARSTRTKHRAKDIELASRVAPESSEIEIPTNSTSTTSNLREDSMAGQVCATTIGLNTIASLRWAVQSSTCKLGAWLYLVCGVSRATVTRTLKAVGCIVNLAIKLGQLSATTTGTVPPTVSITLPRDVRTAMASFPLEPKLIRSICCPKCFKQYPLAHLPQHCDYRETSRSRQCSEELWVARTTRAGSRVVPRRLYTSQDFESWLQYFLSCPGIEDEIDKSYAHRPNAKEMSSLWDSPAWRSLGSFTTTPGNLTFTYFIDWFNPFTNKIAGKTVSAGAIMFACLNLPPHLQHRPEYTFFAGITPPPKEPTMETITAVSDPVIRQFERMWHGKIIRTHRHPQGSLMRVGVLAAIGDLLAIRKGLGYAGVVSKAHFCSFCHLHRNDIEELDLEKFNPRNGTIVRAAAEEWRMATTKKKRAEVFREHGVRWSSLHRLVYRDPIKHTVLGLMHNWIEGVLQHHARVRWGLEAAANASDKETSTANFDSESEDNDLEDCKMDSVSIIEDSDIEMLDVEMLDDEIQGLHEESEQAKSNSSSSSMQPIIQPLAMANSLWDLESNNSLEDSDFSDNSMVDEEEFEEDEDMVPIPGVKTFSLEELSAIRLCISDARIPSWVERPPNNLGEKTHGKLKADQWLKLFSVFLPLILPEIWTSNQDPTSQNLLANFYSLVTCTNIVCSYTVSNDSADLYLHHYINYRKTASELFPHAPSRPNHHFAMHNADLMKFWGPLMYVSEFSYEQHNGTLQKIKTNGHMWEIDLTMLRQICRRSRIVSVLNRDPTDPISSLLRPKSATDYNSKPKSEPHSSHLTKLSEHAYSKWLHYLNAHPDFSSKAFRHRTLIPHPEGSQVLPLWTSSQKYLHLHTHVYSTYEMHQGNSSIIFKQGGDRVSVGFIQAIWMHDFQGKTHTYLLMSPHVRLSTQDAALNPYSQYPGFMADIVYAQTPPPSHHIVIEDTQIIGHVPYYIRPKGTFGIKQSTLVLINSLHRNRT